MKGLRTLLESIKHSSLRGWIQGLQLPSLYGRGLGVVLLLLSSLAHAQIKVGGNIYGGGNQGNVDGSTTVTVQSGNLNKVFGGARMANVGGNAYVNIDGANAQGYMVINYVYGGNDIAGTIGTAAAVSEPLPAELEGNRDGVDDTWNTYVHLSAKTTTSTTYFTQDEIDAAGESDPAYGKTTNDIKTRATVHPENKKVYIGQLFAGGNGNYTYTDSEGNPLTDGAGNYIVKDGETTIASRATAFNLPEVAKSYLDVQGGSIVYAYGGGNNATVTEKAVIHVDNPTAVVNEVFVTDATGLEDEDATEDTETVHNILTTDRFRYDMGINTGFSFPSSSAFQIGRFFGGNNRAEMSIRPTWNLLSGKIRNLYSGGNRGAMTSPEGLLLEIAANSTIVVDNLYGGCRMADVCPKVDGVYTPVTNLPGYYFPNELSARVLIRGGDINNVYGGNDVTGMVYGGNAIGIRTTIRGDVYGGGNGAYPYTDDPGLQNDDIYGDLFYETDGTVASLNNFRPNAEQVSIHVTGTDERHPTIVKGSIYCGGNCATIQPVKANPLLELKIGSHAIADKVFLGNNGEKMVDDDLLERFATVNSLQLTDPTVFADYMEGVTMTYTPSVVFDAVANGDDFDYEDNSSYIGSFYCGGNVGSMAIAGKNTYHFTRRVNIFNKFVGGCNNADVAAGTYNAAYEGGVLGAKGERGESSSQYYTDTGLKTGKIKDRLEINLSNLTISPLRWNADSTQLIWNTQKWGVAYAAVANGTTLTADKTYFTSNKGTGAFTAEGTEVATGTNYFEMVDDPAVDGFVPVPRDPSDHDIRVLDGNVYGGCYNSGHVNGNVVININEDILKRDEVFGAGIYGRPGSGVSFEDQRDDVNAVALTVFGGGCGEDTEIWGSATVNMNKGYAFQVFGGGEEGIVGKKNDEGEYEYNAAYSTYVNLKGANAGYSPEEEGPVLAEAEYIYGGGNEGDVCGDAYVNLGNGRFYDAFGGACNADIYGGVEVIVGHNGGFPWSLDNIYGGNDFGGAIRGFRNHTTAVLPRTVFDPEMLKSSTYVKYIQGRVDTIFGGCYGSYDYTDRIYQDYTDDEGNPKLDGEGHPVFSFPTLFNNSFVYFTPADHSSNKLGIIFGGSAGFPGNENVNNTMQSESYVLIDDTKTKDANRFATTDVFGGGAFAGVGLPEALGAGHTCVDLYAGSLHNVYGGSNQEGLIGYTHVNVPEESTIKLNAIFGGGRGYSPADITATPALGMRYCDNYVTCVDYKGANAIVEDAIYGGNQNSRISCDTYINITVPVLQSSGYQATIYGAGYGSETVSGRTNVFMNNGSNAYKVFGGGRDGNVFNFASLKSWLGSQFLAGGIAVGDVPAKVTAYGDILRDFGTYIAANPIHLPENVGTYVNGEGNYDGTYTNDIMPTLEKPMPDYHQTNVHIMDGGNVSGYAYGGGFGSDAVVSGTTFIELKGGNVDRDIYGGGQGGPVYDEFNFAKDGDPSNDFVATTNVLIEGGMVRNVYGGGYLGHVGKHTGEISASNVGDIPAVANVTIGKVDGKTFYDGIPAILRNAYGGGEGGSVYGTANLTINNGYIGYRYKDVAAEGAMASDWQYVPELDDRTPNAIVLAGNAFGGGYVVNSYVDVANVTLYGGTIRGSVYGGGEVGPIGRGTMKDGATGGIANGKATIYKPGKTLVKVYDGHVCRNVFGGGRGHDSWGGDGTMYMDEEVLKTVDLKCKGYIFGQTEVDIYGGEIGTDEGVAEGYGNVFGGSDIGSVYSAYELANGTLCIGKKEGTRYTTTDEGYYYKAKKNGAGYDFIDDAGNALGVGAEKHMTEDCKVVVEPWCKATADITISDSTFAEGAYVPTSYLNFLGNKNDVQWNSLSKADVNKVGIIIHNAVFAGGNTSPGSTEVYANTTTVFGNATASIHDAYHRDLITVGTGYTGGLYGDGNLTLVDGYRELNITNYGTDYYHITPEITLEQYKALPVRESAYYEIRYKCLKQCSDRDGKIYAVNATITADELQNVFEGVNVTVDEVTVPMLLPGGKPQPTYWKENGVCSRYAGRIMNTIQRSDFCGVFGSRMVMRGAMDRVPETVDYTKYTINRVREVSLNKKASVRTADARNPETQYDDYWRYTYHGNYFGIYSVVNHLGALSSDLDFQTAKRITDNDDADTYKCTAGGKTYGTATYYDWKEAFHEERKRNNGNSHNKVALASGVYLELTNETGTGTGLYEKDWGTITGVVELDLINVQPGMGGGYVYARNEHGVRSGTGKTHTILTALNTGAVTKKQFQYTDDNGTNKEWETSGNFVHSTQTIIDDCYNIGDRYKDHYLPPGGVPAHYWYIKGAVYIYDQYISAFTGSPNAYSEVVSIPLTITSASHGKMTLLNVDQNRYAYYAVNSGGTQTPLGPTDEIALRELTYKRNEAINAWDYSQLTASEKKLFVDDTYVVTADCELDGEPYEAGTVILPGKTDGSEPGTYYYLKLHAPTKILEEGDTEETPYVHHTLKDEDVDFDYVFRPSNNVSHNTGYMLTYNIDNPGQWNTWYTPKSGSSLTGKKDSEQIKSETLSDYEDGPTYTPNVDGLFGQQSYGVGSIISEDIYDTYQDVKTNHPTVIPSTGDPKDPDYQASFYPAYIVTADVLETTNKNDVEQRFHKDATLSKEDYSDGVWATMTSSVDEAYVVTSTIQLSKTEFIYRNTYMSEAKRQDLYDSYKDGTEAEKKIAAAILENIVPAYYCTTAGKYGGNYYETGHNYRGLAAFSSMPESDRSKFTFNYDALDLLIDPNYSRNSSGVVVHAEGQKYQYDSAAGDLAGATANKAQYSLPTPIDYTATYKGGTSLTYIDDNDTEQTATNGDVLSRTEYERLPNEQYHFAPITVGKAGAYYVVTETIVLGDTPYAAGQVITKETFDGLNADDKLKVQTINFTTTGTYYYCRDAFTMNADNYVTTPTLTDVIATETTYTSAVPKGAVINNVDYAELINKQKNFSIHGMAPTETSTLYVARNSDINDLTAEKIITVVYQYDYVESDMSGQHITPVSERHVLNIHLSFKSGVPTVEDIQAPDIILPGTTLSMPEPYVTPGAYEITGGGWMLFDNESDAESHINGVEYTPASDPLYLYQNKNFLAYYAKTYLGKTFSNHVPVSVANYHDLKKVMDDTEHHYYIDHRDVFEHLKVEPKIYINNYSGAQDGLDLLKNLYDLTLVQGGGSGYTVSDDQITNVAAPGNTDLEGHHLVHSRIAACNNLELFLRTDIAHADDPAVADEWTPIGSTSETCFEGTLHGDGHYISGIDNSLFNHLCGDVYNLGVQGSFTGAGIAETGGGYVENCWISTSSTAVKTSKPVFGDPNRSAAQQALKGPVQLVNTYYQEEDDATNKYTNHTASAYGTPPTRKPASAFYNGEVAYDLNGFYLYKRYCDQTVLSGSDDQQYSFYTIGEDSKVALHLPNYYASHPLDCSTGSNDFMYVEDRFSDGDFRYADGTIPTEDDERRYEVTVVDPETGKSTTTVSFFPIWPDDYLFFGQKLTYGYSASQAHQDVPTAIARFSGRLSQNADANRVYRAPAYYRNNTMSVAHFNPQAYLAAKSADGTKTAYPGMTAIDFADHRFGGSETYKTYERSLSNGWFYPPLLDDGGLLSIVNIDETKNLLAYAPAASAMSGYVNKATHDVLAGYFMEPAYDDHYSNDKYRKVAKASTSSIYGHLVQSTLTATNDHLLVDKEEFNAPIAYNFDGDHLMWYQRDPIIDEERDIYEFVDRTKGWQAVSIPFTAELVTTNDKGEITHFYEGSETSKNGTGTKIGHEYWLREFNRIQEVESDAKASFLYPSASGTEDKNFTNTFLWDHYYKNTPVHDQQDKNYDIYQTYYEKPHTHASYPLLTAATPYLIGFPGATYYEFDLSGNFEAENTAADNDPELSLTKLEAQTITFASKTGASIHESDIELPKDVEKTLSGATKDFTFTFHSNYLRQDLSTTDYSLKADGSQFDKVTAEGGSSVSGGATALPFRPYFTANAVSKGGTKRKLPSHILFLGDYGIQEEQEPEPVLSGDLEIFAHGRNIVTRSHMAEATTVRIVSIGGVTIANFVIKPGQTIETPVQAHGAYIVNRKKLFIK